MTKYENIIKQKANNKPIDLDAIARKYKMSVADVKSVRQMIHDAELETSLVKAVGMNSPEMKAAKEEINDLKNKIASLEECMNSKDYFKDSDYQFLIDENHRLEQQYLEVIADNKKLAQQIDHQVDRLRKAGM